MIFSLLALLLAGYPLAIGLRLGWVPRLLATAALGMIGGAGLAWISGTFLSWCRPDLPVRILGVVGAALLIRDLIASRATWQRPTSIDLALFALAVGLAVLQCTVMMTSGWKGGALMLAVHHSKDALAHLSISAMLRPGAAFALPWPPPAPFWGDQPLANYHPLSDVTVSLVAGHNDQVTAYFRLLPPLYSLLFSGTVAWTLAEWEASPSVRAVGMAMAVACGSLGHLLRPLGFDPVDPFWESHFWMSQPFSMLYNPPFALSLGALFAGLALLSRLGERPLATMAAVAVLWGFGFGVKAFLSVLVLAALPIAAMLAPRGERRSLLMVTIATTAAAVLMFVLTTHDAGGVITFEPGWAVSQLPWRTGIPPPTSWRGVPPALAWTILTFVFVIGNLGVRLAGVKDLYKALHGDVPQALSARRIAALVAVFGLALSLLVATRGVHWNAIQFGYYTLALLPLWAAPQIAAWTRAASWPVRVLLVVAMAALALPTSLMTMDILDYGLVVPKHEVDALRELKHRVPVGSMVLVVPGAIAGRAPVQSDRFSAPYDSTETLYVSALSARPSYYAGEGTLDVVGITNHTFRREDAVRAGRLPRAELEAWAVPRRIAAVYRGGETPRVDVLVPTRPDPSLR